MEILFVRHAESLWNIRATEDLDSDLSDFGKQTSLLTAKWLSQNFDFTNYTMLVSPYLRTLKTARDIVNECVNLVVEVETFCREHHVGEGGPKEFIEIPFRTKEFPNFDWSETACEFGTENAFRFPNRDLQQFIYDTELFIDALQTSDRNYVVVSHAVPIKVMSDIATGMNVEEMIQDYADCNKMCKHIKNNSLTWIKDGKAVWLSKVVY